MAKISKRTGSHKIPMGAARGTSIATSTILLVILYLSKVTSRSPDIVQNFNLQDSSRQQDDRILSDTQILDLTRATTISTTALVETHLSTKPISTATASVQANTAQPLDAESSTTSRVTPTLRLSLEEKASELSKKYLNLEHENWRLKQHHANQHQAATVDTSHQQPGPINSIDHQEQSTSSAAVENQITKTTSLPNVAERDTTPAAITGVNGNESVSTSTEHQQVTVPATKTNQTQESVNIDDSAQHPLRADVQEETQVKRAPSQQQQAASSKEPHPNVDAADSVVNRPRSRPAGGRRLQSNGRKLNHYDIDNELFQCHRYLQRHSSSSANSNVIGSDIHRLSSDLQLPCSCDLRQHVEFDSSVAGKFKTAAWLSCDNVQLIGSHLFVSNSASSGHFGANSTDRTEDESENLTLVFRFSQRDTGLQVLHSQMFHYLQLNHLTMIDLSNNRIRQIKMDVFHGIELKLEHLNLANNLLGDSRAIFSDSQDSSGQVNGGKLIFATDELSRLNKLLWLSLRNNKISQLSPNVFARPAQQSELRQLDLSNNLLRSVPSSSVMHLDKLEILNLSGNKISILDQTSKFPKSLKYLDLSQNLISIVRRCDVIDLTNLIEFDLSHNQLSNLDQSAFVSSQVNLLVNREQIQSALEEGRRDSSGQNDLHGEDTPSEHQLRQKREAAGEILDELEGSHDIEDELEASESLLSSLITPNQQKQQVVANVQQTMRDDPNATPQLNSFNATLRLNISFNFLENVPGDSLLKFPHLQQLDLSNNRIRRLDPNYLCSIYNLVENLQHLDLSGNLLHLPYPSNSSQEQPQPSATAGSRSGESVYQLNKLFGCLQRLEKLQLSTNRLGSLSVLDHKELEARPPTFIEDNLEEINNGYSDEDLMSSASGEGSLSPDALVLKGDRIVIRFGESFGSRQLKSLDLSDNQLKMVPLVEQILSQPPNALNASRDAGTNSQINQWMASRLRIEELSLNYNSIDRLDEQDFEMLFDLRHLELDFNKLTQVPSKLFRRFTCLERLSLVGNRIALLEPLNEILERSAKSLRVLSLSNNRLTTWPSISKPIMVDSPQPAAFPNDDSAPGYPQETRQLLWFALEELNLDGNLFTSANLTSLFDQLIHMRSLKKLNLSFNLLSKVKSEWFKFANHNLQHLSLTGNKINNIELGAFAANQIDELTHLSLDHNLLKELKRKTFDSMPRVKELNLAHNLIHTINSETFNQINSLRVLKLNNNKLTNWKCEYFSNLCNSLTGNINADLDALQSPNYEYRIQKQTSTASLYVSSLTELDLSHNSLSQLRVNSISVHTKLQRLNLEHNKLAFIPHDLFRATTTGSTVGRQVQLVSSLKYLNLAHNRIQTIENINFKPLRNLLSLDLSYNELQTLGSDVVLMDQNRLHQEQASGKVIISNNFTNLFLEDELVQSRGPRGADRKARELSVTTVAHANIPISWPVLSKLRQLDLSNNQITMLNQSILSELSPFSQLKLNLSSNLLDSDSLPAGFFTKISVSQNKGANSDSNQQEGGSSSKQSSKYDLIFTLKLESLDLSHNRLNEFPVDLLENHYSSMETCNLSFNRIQNLAANSNMMLHIKSLNLEFNPLSRESNELLLFERRNARVLNLAATRLFAIHQATLAPENTSGSAVQIKHRLANQTSQLDLIRSISRQIDAPYLRQLNLSSNQLVWLAANVFDKMHSLQVLDLSNNQLTRLHLLNNQLASVSPTLEYLNMASNLFTNIDANDFSQLSRIKHLDLSNLLSLQKMNCKFLVKLNSLKVLKMVNYPQLRQSVNNQLSNLLASSQISDRLLRKIRHNLIMSTVGSHCFRDDQYSEIAAGVKPQQLVWFNLDELELELFNSFTQLQGSLTDDGFKLTDELRQLLGPKTKHLSIYGLNITSLSDDALLGITNEEFHLKISYTSLPQLPLGQIFSSVAKKSKLYLDFRNNNIQTIDMNCLQWLDELQQNNREARLSHVEMRPTLKLANNPFRCDCQARPLWLWLNQRWDYLELPPTIEENVSANDTSTMNLTGPANSPNHMIKFGALSQSSDMKCHFPQKLRGKLAQHVYYNDLVCKSSLSTASHSGGNLRHPRKRLNETTKSSEALYLTSMYGDSVDSDDLDEEEYLDADPKMMSVVRLTRFNRYQPVVVNYSSLFVNSMMPLPSSQGERFGSSHGEEIESRIVKEDDADRIAKRDENSISQQGSLWSSEFVNSQPVSTNYAKHRPNTHQRHTGFSTLTSSLNQIPFKKGLGATGSSRLSISSHKTSYLTDSDVMILAIISVSVTVMFFIITSICFFKYKMDRGDKEQILSSTHNKLLMSEGFLVSGPNQASPSASSGSRESKKATSASSSPKKAGKKSQNDTMVQQQQVESTTQKNVQGVAVQSPRVISMVHANRKPQLIVPLGARPPRPHTENFLMRSPTIRRMHGLATNASDWFKYTLRAYPYSAAGRRRRRLFLTNSIAPGNSQLNTAQLEQHFGPAAALPSSFVGGCPAHAFKVVRGFQEQINSDGVYLGGGLEESCNSCRRLLMRIHKNGILHEGPVIRPQPEITSRHHVLDLDPPDVKQSTVVNQDRGMVGISEPAKSNPDYFSQGFIKMPTWHINAQESQVPGRFQRYSSQINPREQHVRPMRTFGVNNRSSINTIASSKTQQSESIDLNQSQIPTVDVDGLFTYQTESQIGSSYHTATPTCQDYQVAEVASGMASDHDQEDRPMIVQNSVLVDSVLEKGQPLTSDQECPSVTGTMRDECSRSSSPVAYRFMRSSPSATTVSSSANNRYTINKMPPYCVSSNDGATKQQQPVDRFPTRTGFLERLMASDSANTLDTSVIMNESSRQRAIVPSIADGDNNNQVDYAVHHKPDAVERAADQQGDDPIDDQVVVSRL